MNCVTGFLLVPGAHPPRPFGQPGATFFFFYLPFSVNGSIVQGTPRPLTLQVAAFLVLSMPPGHYLPPPQRLPAASSTIDLLGRRTRRLPLERKGRGRCGLHRTIVGKQLRSYQRFMVVTSIVPMMSCFCCR